MEALVKLLRRSASDADDVWRSGLWALSNIACIEKGAKRMLPAGAFDVCVAQLLVPKPAHERLAVRILAASLGAVQRPHDLVQAIAAAEGIVPALLRCLGAVASEVRRYAAATL